jgi:hypothetical protein
MMKKPSCECGRAFVFDYPSQPRSSLFNNVSEVRLNYRHPRSQKQVILGLLEAWWEFAGG